MGGTKCRGRERGWIGSGGAHMGKLATNVLNDGGVFIP